MQINLKYVLIVIVLATVVGGGILWYIANQEFSSSEFSEVKKPEKIKPIDELVPGENEYEKELVKEPTNIFLAGSGYDFELAIIYNLTEKRIISKKIINLNGLGLMPSGFGSWGSNDSIQYNTTTKQILLAVTNTSAYDGSSLTDAPYSAALWATSFGDDSPQVIFSTDYYIFSWITHPSKPVIYITHQPSYTNSNKELLEINILSKEVRKVSDLGEIVHLELVMSKDENFIFRAARLSEQNKILLERINLESGEISDMGVEGKSGSFNTNQLSPNEKSFAFFGGWMASTGLRVSNLEDGKDEALPLSKDIDISNFNILWSGDSENLIFWVKNNGNHVPFIYSFEQKNGKIINELINKYPLIWAPSQNYIALEDKTYGGLSWDVFDLDSNNFENILSSSSFHGTVGAYWFRE